MRSFASIAAAAVVALPLAIAAPNKANKMDASYYKPEQVIDTCNLQIRNAFGEREGQPTTHKAANTCDEKFH